MFLHHNSVAHPVRISCTFQNVRDVNVVLLHAGQVDHPCPRALYRQPGGGRLQPYHRPRGISQVENRKNMQNSSFNIPLHTGIVLFIVVGCNFKPEVKIALLKTTRPWLRKSKQKWGNQVKKITLFSLASEVIFRLDFCLEATIVVKLLVSFCYLTCTYFRSIGLVSLVANYLWLF